MTSSIRVAVVDDQSLFRQALAQLIAQFDDFLPPYAYASGNTLLEDLRLAAAPFPDIVLLDLEMPGLSGIETNEQLQRDYPDIKVIILTVHGGAHLITSLIRAGADGFLTKNCERLELEACLRMVRQQGFYINQATMEALQASPSQKQNTLHQVDGIPMSLSKREVEVLQLICREYSSPEIAEKLFISLRTVEGHRTSLLQKTGCRNIAGLVLFAMRNHLHPAYF